MELIIDGSLFKIDFWDTGVPHAVIFVDELQDTNVEKIGNAIRYHAHFKPTGTNTNFVRVIDRGKIRIRTYERGVEAETLACGTGAIASASASNYRGFTDADLKVEVALPDVLEISLKNGYERPTLAGYVVESFKGEIEV